MAEDPKELIGTLQTSVSDETAGRGRPDPRSIHSPSRSSLLLSGLGGAFWFESRQLGNSLLNSLLN